MTSRMFDFFDVKSAPTNVESSENSHRTFQPVKPGVNKPKNTGLKVRQPFAEKTPLTPIKTNLQTVLKQHSRSVLQDTPILKKNSAPTNLKHSNSVLQSTPKLKNKSEPTNSKPPRSVEYIRNLKRDVSTFEEFGDVFENTHGCNCHELEEAPYDEFDFFNTKAIVVLKSQEFREPEPPIISEIDVSEYSFASEKDLDWKDINTFPEPEVPVPTIDDDTFDDWFNNYCRKQKNNEFEHIDRSRTSEEDLDWDYINNGLPEPKTP